MKMGSAGIGLGLGVKDFRAVFVFHDKEKLAAFIEKGWDFSGQADAAAKADDKGAGVAAAKTVVPGAEVFQITKNGIAQQATLQGTNYWKGQGTELRGERRAGIKAESRVECAAMKSRSTRWRRRGKFAPCFKCSAAVSR